jgi:hypothetical protein
MLYFGLLVTNFWRKKPPPTTTFIMEAACLPLNSGMCLQTGRHNHDHNVDFTAEDTSNVTGVLISP